MRHRSKVPLFTHLESAQKVAYPCLVLLQPFSITILCQQGDDSYLSSV